MVSFDLIFDFHGKAFGLGAGFIRWGQQISGSIPTYSTVTLFARFLGLSTSHPLATDT